MKNLSRPHAQLKDHYEVLVIGSGYGGGVAASRLARAGRQVCVLERGKEFTPGEYPDTAAKLIKQLQTDLPHGHIGAKTALFDFRANKDINVIVGCGLGGTSLINAGINEPPDPRIFDDTIWPKAIREDASNGLLDKFKAYGDDMLKPAYYPSHYPPLSKQQALAKAVQHTLEKMDSVRINVNFKTGLNHAGIAQQACVNCGDCMTGCNYNAKNTLLMNYLPDASNHGAEFFTTLQVDYVERHANKWRVYIHPATAEKSPSSIDADIVILAAGTLGSSEILLRSREHGLTLSTRLGRRFSGNGDMLAVAYNTDQPMHAIGFGRHKPTGRKPVGPTSTAVIDNRKASELEDSMVLASASIPGALAPLLPKALAALALLTGEDTDRGWLDKWREKGRKLQSMIFGSYTGAVRNTQFYLSVSHDDSAGTMTLKDNRLRIHWPDAGKALSFQKANNKMKKMTIPLGGTYIQNPVWNNLSNQSLLTGHPLGGCVMADSSANGVVNHKGQVYNPAKDSSLQGQDVHQGLYVMDGAVIPRSVGINPLNVITTLAERSCHHLIQDYGWPTNYDLKNKSGSGL
jgi:cholesterol oxidase